MSAKLKNMKILHKITPFDGTLLKVMQPIYGTSREKIFSDFMHVSCMELKYMNHACLPCIISTNVMQIPCKRFVYMIETWIFISCMGHAWTMNWNKYAWKIHVYLKHLTCMEWKMAHALSMHVWQMNHACYFAVKM